MKPPMPKSSRKSRFRLEWVATFFIVAAVIFTLYCAVQVTFPSGAGSGRGQGVTGGPPQSLRRRALDKSGAHGGSIEEEGGAEDDGGFVAKHVQASPPCPEAQVKTVEKVVTKLVYGLSTHNDRAYHVVTTVQGFANHWQARLHYYWYKKQREACQLEPPCDMGGFTRLLHSGQADDLMDEIPTVVVDPLPSSVMKNSSYVVLNRPYAFLMWLQRVSIPEKYFLMAEADHLFLRPLPNMMNGDSQGAALFTYIVPENYPDIVRKFIGNVAEEELKKVPHIGNSPTFVSVEEFRTLAPVWYNTTLEIFDDEAAHSAWNWVLEMYGYALATYRVNQHKNMVIHPNMLAHPPFDKQELDNEGRPFYILHLTYPCRYDAIGNFTDNSTLAVWTFDKREYMSAPPPRNLKPPPANVENQLVRQIIAMVNEATSSIPCWDDYVKTSKVSKTCLGGGGDRAVRAGRQPLLSRKRVVETSHVLLVELALVVSGSVVAAPAGGGGHFASGGTQLSSIHPSSAAQRLVI